MSPFKLGVSLHSPDENNSLAVVRATANSSFDQLITNRGSILESDNLEPNDVMQRVRDYLYDVLIGDGKEAHCPYVSFVERENGYYVTTIDSIPAEIDLEAVCTLLEDEFKRISPTQTHDGQPTDPVTTVAAFSDPVTKLPEFFELMDTVRNQERQRFLDQGLMLAHMHPYHPRGGQGKHGQIDSEAELYTAGIPLLMVRRMHEQDRVFMNTREEKAAYKKFFG